MFSLFVHSNRCLNIFRCFLLILSRAEALFLKSRHGLRTSDIRMPGRSPCSFLSICAAAMAGAPPEPCRYARPQPWAPAAAAAKNENRMGVRMSKRPEVRVSGRPSARASKIVEHDRKVRHLFVNPSFQSPHKSFLLFTYASYLTTKMPNSN